MGRQKRHWRHRGRKAYPAGRGITEERCTSYRTWGKIKYQCHKEKGHKGEHRSGMLYWSTD